MNNTIPAVEKAVQLLLALAEGEKTQAELSAGLGISMSTAYRILTTLQAHRWVRKNSGAALYHYRCRYRFHCHRLIRKATLCRKTL